MIESLPLYAGKPKKRAIPPPSRYVRECQRLIDARRAETTEEGKADADWALQYLMTLKHQGRLDEYFAQLDAKQASA